MYAEELLTSLEALFATPHRTLEDALELTNMSSMNHSTAYDIALELEKAYRNALRLHEMYDASAPFEVAERYAFSTLEDWEQNMLRAWQAEQIQF